LFKQRGASPTTIRERILKLYLFICAFQPARASPTTIRERILKLICKEQGVIHYKRFTHYDP